MKAFEDCGVFGRASARVGHRTAEEALRLLRRAISRASAQLKDVRDRGDSLVIVVANLLGHPLLTGVDALIWAMYGDPEMTTTIRPDGSADDWRMVSRVLLRDLLPPGIREILFARALVEDCHSAYVAVAHALHRP